MSIREFNVTIKLSNAEMQEPFHVSEALRELAARLDDRVGFQLRDSFGIRDINGNQVGSATVDRLGVKGERYSPNFDSATRQVTGVDARQAIVQIGMLLGKNERWDSDSLVETIAAIVNERSGSLPACNDQSDDDLSFWADIAEEFGEEHDRPEPEFDPDADREEDEMDGRD